MRIKQLLLLAFLFVAYTTLAFGATTVFSETFTEANSSYASSVQIGTTAFTAKVSGVDWGARVNNNMLEISNDASGAGNVLGWGLAYNTSAFSSPYTTTLSSNPAMVTWSFNMRQLRSDPAGFASGSYGAAFILAGSSTSANNTGTGYAVVLGQSGSTDPIRLAKYSGGLLTGLTNIIASNTTGLTDFGTEYLSIKVTYTPSTNTWELFLRNDGTSAFADPATGTLTSQGTAIDNTYTGSALAYTGAYWQGSTAGAQFATFDNINVIVDSGGGVSEPTAQPTTLVFNNVTTTSFDVSFTAASPAADGYLAVRKSGSAPTTDPVDGTAYTAGNTLGDGTVVFSGSGVSFSQSSLNPSTTYYYKVYSFNGSGGTTNYLATSPLAGNQATDAGVVVPTVTTASVSAITDTSATCGGSISADGGASVTAKGVCWNTTGSPTISDSHTTDGTGTDAFVSSIHPISPNQLYYVRAYATNSAGTAYGDPVQFTTLKSEPAAHVTNFAAGTPTSGAIPLTWTDATADGYLIKGSTVSAFDIVPPVDGSTESNSTLVRNVTQGTQTYTFTGLEESTTYYYRIYPYNNSSTNIDYKIDSTPSVSAATTASTSVLYPGDIAIIAVNTDSERNFVFVALADIPANTTITFTDNAWTSADGAFATSEGNIQWSHTSTLSQGSTVTIALPTTFTASVGSITTSASFALSASGDQIIAFEGDWASRPTDGSDSRFLYAFSTENFISTGSTSSNTSYLPGVLTDYSVAMTASATETDNAYFANGNTAQTAVSVSGSKSELLALFNDNTKYFMGNDLLTLPTYTITVGAGGTVTEPENQPTNLVFSSVGSNSFTVSYTAAASRSVDGYLAIRKTGSAPTSDPVDGTSYVVGNTLGDGTVVYRGSGTTFSQASLTPSTAYYYKIYSFNGSGTTTDYLVTSPLAGNQTTTASDPLGGYYTSVAGLTGASLKSGLHTLIKNTHTTEFSYTAVTTQLGYTDQDSTNTSNVIEIYTGWSIPAANYGGETTDWNKEHVWSKSHGDFGDNAPAGTDLHHLRPSDATVNSMKSNRDFDEGASAYTDASPYNGYSGVTGCYYSTDIWEPREVEKGDVARMIFYMATRYEGTDTAYDLELVDYTNSAPSSEPYYGKLSTLLSWHNADPPDAWELRRNNRIQERQGNRNPFIDHPEYVSSIWGGAEAPSVTTDAITSIGLTTATGGGEVTSAGSASVTARGVCWNTTGSPTVSDSYTTNGTGTGTFESSLTSLTSGQFYYVRAYATNSVGTTYGNEVTFTALKAEPAAHVTSFAAGTPTSASIPLTWTDATADGYLIKGSTVSYADITAPVDGTEESNGTLVQSVAQGTQTKTMSGLTASTTYYFKIYPFTNSGTNINYKTDGVIPEASAATTASAGASVALRPTHIDLSSTTSESAVKMTLSGYASNDAKYRLYNGSYQYNCWDATSGTYISSTSYSAGPLVLGTPTTTSTFWILFQRGTNTSQAVTYRDRLDPYTTTYQTVTVTAADSITSSFALSGTFTGTDTYPLTGKYVVLAYNGSTVVSAASTELTTGTLTVVCPNGTTIDKIEIRTALDALVESKTGSWTTTTNVGTFGTTVDPEPTNHASNFAAGTPTTSTIPLTWSDASRTAPTGYLIKGSSVSYAAITAPTDGTTEANTALVHNVSQGVGLYTFTSLTSNTTYYFKIYPYTNSGLNIDYKTDGTVPQVSAQTNVESSTLLLEENFEYEAGTHLHDNGWTPHSSPGTNPPIVGDAGLTYTSYPSISGLCGETINTGEDVSKTFTPQTTGSVYTSLLINVISSTEAGDYVYHFSTSPAASDFKGKLFVGRDASNNVRFGITKSANVGTSVAWTGYDYALDTTYLVVMKYTFGSGTADDAVIAWINPDFSGAEPAAQLSAIVSETDIGTAGIGSIAIRQSNVALKAKFDGIRVGTSWAELFPGLNPTIGTSGTLNPFSAVVGTPSESQHYTVTGSNLSSNITVTAPTGFQLSLSDSRVWASSVEVPQTGGSANSIVYVRFNPSTSGSYSAADISHTATDATTVYKSVSGNAYTGLIDVTESLTAFTGIVGTPTAAQTYQLNCSSFSNYTNLSVTGPFQISNPQHPSPTWETSLQLLAEYDGYIDVRYNPVEAGNQTGAITHSAEGGEAETVIVNLSGSASLPYLVSATPDSLNFTTDAGTTSEVQSYALSGSNLTENIIVLAPASFEISTSSSGPWTDSLSVSPSFNANIYVHFVPTNVGITDVDVTNESGDAFKYVRLIGTATMPSNPMNIQVNQTLTRDFDIIGTSATATLLADWRVAKSLTVGDQGTWAAGGTATERIGGNGMITTASNGIYNFGAGDAASALDRAIGFLSSGSATKSGNLYTKVTNTGATTITSFDISYKAEKYRKGSNAQGFSVKLYYSTDGSTWTYGGDNLKASWTADADNTGYTSAPGDSLIKTGSIVVDVAENSSIYLCWSYGVSSLTTTTNAQALAIDDVSITATALAITQTPTFDPAPGLKTGPTYVSLDCSTENAVIYYTTDGNTPNTSSTEYTTPIYVTETTTIKAIALAPAHEVSPVASGTYTIPIEVANIAALRALTPGTGIHYKLTGEVVLTLKTSSYNTKYVQDATGAVMIYDNGGIITTSYNIGDGITGMIGTITLYQSMLEFLPVFDPGAASSTGNTVIAEEVSLLNLNSSYQGKLVKIVGASFATTGNFATATNYTITDASGSGILRTQYSDLDYIGTPVPTIPKNIVGVVLQYNAITQFIPRSLAEFTDLSAPDAPDNVKIRVVSNDIIITWDADPTVTNWKVYYADEYSDDDDDYTEVGTYNTNSCTLTGLGATHSQRFFLVKAIR